MLNQILDFFKKSWSHLLWFIAAIVLMVDPKHVYEWAHQHEAFGGIIAAIFTFILAWAGRHRPDLKPQTPQPSPSQQQERFK
jgi:hypothetical protein